MKFRSIAGLFVICCSLALTTIADPFAGNTRDEMRRSAPVSVGEQAPDFTLEDIQGKQVSLSETRGKLPTVLVFYRGHWCPFCAHQLAELRSLLKADEQVRVLAVSVDDHEKTKQLIDKIAADGNGAVNYKMLSDPGHKVIDAYGLHDPAYDGTKFDGIPHPTVYVIDKNGRVAWAKVETDYKVRPSNADIRAALEALN
ncbi:MAG TPA: peroxiredoxin family protein [Pyrinomonadaceae bacterium]|nr:peroxiredoxin family protein [Pyrinomonadaceae bacterium]